LFILVALRTASTKSIFFIIDISLQTLKIIACVAPLLTDNGDFIQEDTKFRKIFI
jgi:hypothetical protein